MSLRFLFASCKYTPKKMDRVMRFSLQWRFMSTLWYRAPSFMGTDVSEKRASVFGVYEFNLKILSY